MRPTLKVLWIPAVLFGIAAFAWCMIKLVPAYPAPEVQERTARAWADTLGMRLTGVTCRHGRCTLAPEHGAPFVAFCGEMAPCALEGHGATP